MAVRAGDGCLLTRGRREQKGGLDWTERNGALNAVDTLASMHPLCTYPGLDNGPEQLGYEENGKNQGVQQL